MALVFEHGACSDHCLPEIVHTPSACRILPGTHHRHRHCALPTQCMRLHLLLSSNALSSTRPRSLSPTPPLPAATHLGARGESGAGLPLPVPRQSRSIRMRWHWFVSCKGRLFAPSAMTMWGPQPPVQATRPPQKRDEKRGQTPVASDIPPSISAAGDRTRALYNGCDTPGLVGSTRSGAARRPRSHALRRTPCNKLV